MGIQRVQSFFPYVGAAELQAAVDQLLPRMGYIVRARVELGPGDIYPGLQRVLDRHAGAGAFVAFARATEERAPAALLVSHLARDRRWDPALVRALSNVLGGFGVGMESWRAGDQYGLGVFYGGRTIELSGSNGGLNDERVHAQYVQHWRLLVEGSADELHPSPSTPLRAWIVDDVRPARASDTSAEPALRRAAIGPVEASQFHDAIDEIGAVGRWLARATFGAEVPFVIIDDYDEALLLELVRRLDVFATAVEFDGLGHPFRWLFTQRDSTIRGVGHSAQEFEIVWRDFCVCFGTSPGAVRWPPGAEST
jgi:hypothetical protein